MRLSGRVVPGAERPDPRWQGRDTAYRPLPRPFFMSLHNISYRTLRVDRSLRGGPAEGHCAEYYRHVSRGVNAFLETCHASRWESLRRLRTQFGVDVFVVNRRR